jgi:hypothetical protein
MNDPFTTPDALNESFMTFPTRHAQPSIDQTWPSGRISTRRPPAAS